MPIGGLLYSPPACLLLMELECCPFLARIVFSDERESFDLEKANVNSVRLVAR